MRADYSFQEGLKEKTYMKLQEEERVVLAAAPASGKTQMGLALVKRYLDEHNATALLLTHGQVLLREQWHDRIKTIDPLFEYTTIRKGSAIKAKRKKNCALIAIPQTLKNLPKDLRIDFLVVDEAHHWYRSPTVQQIISHIKPKKQLLLTGTPSSFIHEGFPICGITINELLKYNVICDPILELVESNYEYELTDYNDKEELDDTIINKEITYIDLDTLLRQIVQRLAAEQRADPTRYDWVLSTTDWASVLKNLRKTMFVCRSQKQAIMISSYFAALGLNYEMSISDLSNGDDGAFNRFEEDDNCHIMIVVNRGILGYSYTELFNVCDFTMSLNVDRVFQLMCRAIRTSKKSDDRKLFFKLTNNALAAATYHVMSYVVAMSLPEYYYACTEYQATKIPVPKEFTALLGEGEAKECRKKPPSLLDLPQLLTFVDIDKKGTNPDSFAYTDFATVKHLLQQGATYSIEIAVDLARKAKSFTDFKTTFNKHYRFLVRVKALKNLVDVFPDQYGNYKWDEEGRPIKKRELLTQEQAIEEMKKYKNRAELKTKNNPIYKVILKDHRKLMDEHLPKTVWSEKEVRKRAQAAKKGKTRRAFIAESGGMSDYLSRTKSFNILDDYFEVKTPKNLVGFRWTTDELFKRAKEYESLSDFNKYQQHASRWAKQQGVYEDLEALFPIVWSIPLIIKKASLSQTNGMGIKAFFTKYKGAKEFLTDKKMLHILNPYFTTKYTNMNRKLRKNQWTEERVLKELKKYKNYSELSLKKKSILTWATRNECLSKIKEHFKPQER